jgi:zeaxanthin glucosyltransferase
MSHIVYVTNGMSSTLNSSLELSRRLVASGYRVSYVSHADIEETVLAHDFPFFRLSADQRFMEAAENDPPPRQLSLATPVAVAGWIRRRTRLRKESSRMEGFEALLGSLQPDLLIIDCELHAAIVTAETLDVPVVLASAWFTIFRHPGIPPLEFRALPASGASGRLWLRLLWVRSFLGGLMLEWKRRFSIEGLRARLSPVPWSSLFIDDIRSVARARGFDLRECARTNWLRPLTYPNIPTLCFNLREVDFPHEPHVHLHYVGPMIARHRVEVRSAGMSGQAWERFLAPRGTGKEGRPLVYCSLGSHWSVDQDFLGRVVDVFRRRPEWDLVLGLGAKLDPAALGPIPDNALILPWAPQLQVLEIADAAIVHGGNTSLNECLAFAVPMLVYSTEHVDQNGCAARTGYHGLGLVGDRRRDTSADIECNVERILTDVAIRKNVTAMQHRILEAEQAGEETRLLQQVMEQHHTARGRTAAR